MIVVQLTESEPFVTKDGSQIRSLLDRTNAPVRNHSLAEATLPAGRATLPHRHPHTEESYYVLSGTGRMTVGAERRDVGPGDAVLIPADSPHRLENTGEAPLVFLCCCSPPYSHDETVMEEPRE
ncbi:MAG: cupin domain-containing protein [Planctomycetota bacterium]